ncbi:MAG: hypothetical protein JSW66_16760 [Phycisphaerales bacterium]|nr:MAG: hypothetical protein JSW66_16760 [Phycisphaerales bacterium]
MSKSTVTNGASPWRIYLSAGSVTLIIAATAGYSLCAGRHMAIYTSSIEASVMMRYKTSLAHLWIEEIIAGDKHEQIETVWGLLDEAERCAAAISQGEQDWKAYLVPLRNEELRRHIRAAQAAGTQFRGIAERRIACIEAASAGSDMDQNFDSTFVDFLTHAELLEISLHKSMNEHMANIRTIQAILIVGVMGSGVLSATLLHTYNKQKSATLKSLEESDASMRREILERKLAEERLTANLCELEQARSALLNMMADIQQAKRELEELNEDLESANRELTRTNKELQEFAYIAAHDLKTPLRAIGTLADWISTDYADRFDQQGKEQVRLLVTKAKQMAALIDDVLHYSSVGQSVQKSREVDLNPVLSEVIREIDPPSHIEVVVEQELPTIVCTETHIIQILQNLLGNAVKYMDKPGGRIKVGCVEQDGFWEFSVADNGPGIDKRHFDRIFKIFQTLSTSDRIESTGIGLSVVKKLVELNKGRVWLESEVGKGSTFFFTLPKQAARASYVPWATSLDAV